MSSGNHNLSKLREKADKILLNGGGPDKAIYTRDLETLVQELNIYQIELEQQNEELMHTQLELEKSRQRFSDLFDNAPFSYFLIYDDYQIINLNATACKFLGGDKGNFINQKISKFIHPASQDTFLFHLRDVKSSNKSLTCDIKLVSRQKEEFYVRLLSKAEKDEEHDGRIFIRVSVSDHTSEIEAEIARKESEEKFRQLAENSPVIIYRTSLQPSFRFDYISPAVITITGYSPEEFYNDATLRYKLLHPADIALYENSSEFISGEPVVMRWARKNGTVIWIEQRNIMISDNGGQPLAVEGTVRDITEQKMAEIALRSSEEKYRTIFEGAPLGIFRSTREGRFIEVNQAFAKMFGYKNPDQVVNEIYSISAQMYVDTLKRSEILENTSKDKVSKFENLYKRKNGEIFHANLYQKEITDEKGDTILEGMVEETTDSKNYERTLKTAIEKAEEGDRLKMSFLQNMSHEIRTPMNAICGFSELLLNETDDNSIRSYTNIINHSSQQLLCLIDDIILYSKLQTKIIPVKLSGFKVFSLIKDVHDSFNIQDIPENILLKYEIDTACKDMFIKGDYDKLRQVLTNLFSNAIKYTNRGEIVIGCAVVDGRIEFSVRDTGIGIPLPEQSTVFNRFYRGQQVEKTSIRGTGLGLSIVKEMVDLLDGSISVESEPGVGSRFFFSVPLLIDIPIETDKKSIDSSATIMKELTVLIVEDEVYNFLYLHAVLDKLVKDIDNAYDGKEAVEMVKHRKYDLILMDLKMPVMDGHEATRKIKKLYPEIPIIAQTAYSHSDEKRRAFESGCDGYLTKPISKEAVINAINLVFSKEL
jgi:PAS domain S-box-containing protein